jgi:8-oxo-dGTP pyrophosphatase MutT (NUDIX family)
VSTHDWLLRCRIDEPALETVWVPSTRLTSPDADALIEEAWQATLARPGVKLFDGPVGRFESAELRDGRVRIALSHTSYRIVVGTNFCNPDLVRTLGPSYLANPLGVSAALRSRDGRMVMGRRNQSVAYYPGLLHPFAGSVEVRPVVNLFDDIRRELREEIGFGPSDIASMRFVGIAQDRMLVHPEAIFVVDSTRAADEIIARVHDEEHAGAEAIDPNRVPPDTTPIARAAIEAAGW